MSPDWNRSTIEFLRGHNVDLWRLAIVGAYHQCGQNLARAAKRLGIGRVTLFRWRDEDETLRSVLVGKVGRPGTTGVANGNDDDGKRGGKTGTDE